MPHSIIVSHTRKKYLLGAVAASLLCVQISTLASAQDTQQAQNQQAGWHGFTTIMVGSAQEFEGSNDYETIPFGSIYLSKGSLYFQTEGAGFVANIWNNNSGFIAGPAFNYRLERGDNISNIAVRNMAPVDAALEIGGFIGYATTISSDYDLFEIRLKGIHDVSDAHEGYSAEASISYRKPFANEATLLLSASATFADENYHQTYFGVSATDAALSGFAPYDAGAGIKDIGANVSVNYPIYRNWGVFGIAGYIHLMGDAKDSPIVQNGGNDSGYFTALGLSYQF